MIYFLLKKIREKGKDIDYYNLPFNNKEEILVLEYGILKDYNIKNKSILYLTGINITNHSSNKY